MHRIVDVGYDRHVGLADEPDRQLRDALFRATQTQHLALGVDLDAESRAHEVGSGAEETRYAAEWRVAVRLRIGVRGGDGVGDDLRRRPVGVANPEIYELATTRARSSLELVEPGEDVRGETGETLGRRAC